MADHDGSATPGRQEIGNEHAAVAVKIVGRLVKDQKIGRGVDLGGECCPCALPARERGKQCGGGCIEPDLGQCTGNLFLQHPVDITEFIERGYSRLRAGKDLQRMARLEQVGDGLVVPDLYALPQNAYPAGHGDRACRGRKLTGDQLQKRRLANAVAPDKADALKAEAKIDIGKKWLTVRRGPREV